jgi:hypothetical protein
LVTLLVAATLQRQTLYAIELAHTTQHVSETPPTRCVDAFDHPRPQVDPMDQASFVAQLDDPRQPGTIQTAEDVPQGGGFQARR